MTDIKITDADLSSLANQICGCSNRDQHRRDTAIIEADRKQVREEVVREVCEWLKNQDGFGEWGEAAYEIKREFLGEEA